MSFNIHVSPREKRRKLIRAVIEALRQRSPATLKAYAKAIRESYQNAYDPKSGKLRAEQTGEAKDLGFISIQVPQQLFLALKYFDRNFGNDSDDFQLLAEEFPDLITNRKMKRRQSNSLVVKKNYAREDSTEGTA